MYVSVRIQNPRCRALFREESRCLKARGGMLTAATFRLHLLRSANHPPPPPPHICDELPLTPRAHQPFCFVVPETLRDLAEPALPDPDYATTKSTELYQ